MSASEIDQVPRRQAGLSSYLGLTPGTSSLSQDPTNGKVISKAWTLGAGLWEAHFNNTFDCVLSLVFSWSLRSLLLNINALTDHLYSCSPPLCTSPLHVHCYFVLCGRSSRPLGFCFDWPSSLASSSHYRLEVDAPASCMALDKLLNYCQP